MHSVLYGGLSCYYVGVSNILDLVPKVPHMFDEILLLVCLVSQVTYLAGTIILILPSETLVQLSLSLAVCVSTGLTTQQGTPESPNLGARWMR